MFDFPRLTGVYAIIVGFHCTLYILLATGPTSAVSEEVNICRDSWWKNLLYITNFGSDPTVRQTPTAFGD